CSSYNTIFGALAAALISAGFLALALGNLHRHAGKRRVTDTLLTGAICSREAVALGRM
ncbi:hypothetical protein L0F63_003836, partial [Massospora cicadina]